MFRDQFCGISNSNLATPDHVTIQGERPAEFPRDTLEYLTVLFQGVWVKCRHDTTPTKILYPNDDIPDTQALAWPVAFGQPRHATDHEIRSEAPAIMSKRGNGPICRNQQRQYIEAMGRLIAHQPSARPCDICHSFADCWIAPEQAVNQRLAERIDRRMVTEQPMVRSGRDHMTMHILDMDNAIPLNPERTDACMIQLFTTHRLYRVPPNLRHIHSRDLPHSHSDQCGRKKFPGRLMKCGSKDDHIPSLY
jgi:hypothetical protein